MNAQPTPSIVQAKRIFDKKVGKPLTLREFLTISDLVDHAVTIHESLIKTLQNTAGNIRSLGPAGALDRVPVPYREWLAAVEAAVALAKGDTP